MTHVQPFLKLNSHFRFSHRAFGLFLALTVLAIQTAIASPALATLQGDETRASEIEDAADNAAKAGDKNGVATIYLKVFTEDGEIPQGLKTTTSVLYGPKRNRGFSMSKSLDSRLVDFELETRAGLVSVIVDATGYAPVSVIVDAELKSGSSIEKEVTLKKGEIRSLLVKDDKGNPIESASVSAHIRLSKNSTSKNGTDKATDEKGNATLKNLSPDLLTSIRVSKKGFETFKLTDNFFVGDRIEVKLTPTPVTLGTVIDHLGNPVANAKIYHVSSSAYFASIKDRKRLQSIGTTDKQGNFETNALSKNGRHVLLAESLTNRCVAINIVAGNTAKFKMPPPRSIQVIFDGGPIDLKPVVVGDEEFSIIQIRQYYEPKGAAAISILIPFEISKVDGKQALTFKGVVSDSLTISHSDLGDLLDENNLKPETNQLVIDVAPFTKLITRTVALTFVDDTETVIPKGTIRVRELEASGKAWGPGQLIKLAEGKARVEISSDQIMVSPEGLIGYVLAGETNHVGVELDAKAEVLSIPVKPAGAIQGTILNTKGEPVSTKVTCRYCFVDREISPFPTDVNVLSNSEGKFLLSPIPLGVKAELRIGNLGQIKSDSITVDHKNPIPTVNLRFPTFGSAKVRVETESGEPLSGAEVMLTMKEKGSHHSTSKRSKSDGSVEFGSIPEDADNFWISVVPPVNFQVPPEQKVKTGDAIEFVLKPGHRLSGRVINQDGESVVEFLVQAHLDGKSFDADALTDAKGEFTFTRLPKRDVTIQARHRWLQKKTEMSKRLTPGKSEPIVLTLVED